MLWGFVADRFGRRRTLIITALMTIPIAPLYLLTTNYTMIVVFFTLQGWFGGGGMHTQWPHYLSERFPTEVRATATGFCYHQGAIFGGLVGPVLSYFATQWHMGFALPMMIGTTFAAGSVFALMLFILRPRERSWFPIFNSPELVGAWPLGLMAGNSQYRAHLIAPGTRARRTPSLPGSGGPGLASPALPANNAPIKKRAEETTMELGLSTSTPLSPAGAAASAKPSPGNSPAKVSTSPSWRGTRRRSTRPPGNCRQTNRRIALAADVTSKDQVDRMVAEAARPWAASTSW